MDYVLIRLTNKDNFINGLLTKPGMFSPPLIPLQSAPSSAISVSAIALKFQDSTPGILGFTRRNVQNLSKGVSKDKQNKMSVGILGFP